MKQLLLILSLLSMVACSGGGGGSAGSTTPSVGTPGGGGGGNTPVVDNTPHDYTIVFYMLTNVAQLHTVSVRQICNDGFAGFRDNSSNLSFQNGNTQGGIGCGAAKNVIFTATNTGTDILYVMITIDGVNQNEITMNLPNLILNPGQTYTFTKGY